ncbi:MAG: polysaccharide biosynthesis tyrosine autokinase [Planctomycetes bacterium]|nr:polysaccharide biosynthesis tyrosine autokinase [Planctomycetota bacterium]
MRQYELSLQDYWRVIRKRRYIIFIVFIAVIVPTFIYTRFQSVVYQAESQVAITERKTGGNVLLEWFYYTPGDPMKSYAEAIKSQEVMKRAGVKLSLIPPETIEQEKMSADEIKTVLTIQSTISTKVVEGTNKIIIYATSSNQDNARLYTNAVAHAFVEYNLAEKTKEARTVRNFIENQVKETETKLRESEVSLQKFREKYQAADIAGPTYNRLEDLKKERNELLKKYTTKHPDVIYIDKQIKMLVSELGKYSQDQITFSQLNRDVTVYTTLYNDLKSRLANAMIEAEKTADVSVVNEANAAVPLGSRQNLNLIIGIILGIILGLALAFIVEQLDTSLGTIEEIETLLKLPVLGVIPYLAKEKEKTSPFSGLLGSKTEKDSSRSESIRSQMILNYSTLSPITEAYRILRTNVIKNGEPTEEGKIIIISSTGPEEGKTITSINLAITMAEKGEKVLLIDIDMRKGLIHKVFSLNKEPGLSEVLMGKQRLNAVIRDITDTLLGGLSYDVITNTPGIDNLHIMTTGAMASHPTELISTSDSDVLLKELKMKYDYIILDCAPILPVTDVLILGHKADFVIMVYRAGKTAKSALVRAVDQLKNANIPIKGVVLNYISPEIDISPNYYYHTYKYYPTEQTAKE